MAWLYVLNGYEGGLPSARYIGIVADAAEKAAAPADYVTGCGPGHAGLSVPDRA